MTKREVAGWVMLAVVAAGCSDAAPSVDTAVERHSSSALGEEVVAGEPVALEREVGCAELPSWRPYSTLPLTYHPPCGFGEMVRTRASRPTPEEELEQARAENTALHERLRKMAAYERRVGAQ
jgi:hypothetical protein